jgi:cytohesin
MGLKKIAIIISINIYATPATPIGLPRFASVSMRPLITKLAQASKLIKSVIVKTPQTLMQFTRNHKKPCMVALAAATCAAIAHPKTRSVIKNAAKKIPKLFWALALAGNRMAMKILPTWLYSEPTILREEREWEDLRQHLPRLNYIPAADGEVAILLRDFQQNPYVAVDNHWSPLHIAIINNQEDRVQALLAEHADIEARDINGRTPLYFSALLGHQNIVQALIDAGAQVNSQNYHDYTPLDIAAAQGHIPVVRALLREHATLGIAGHTTPLHMAAKYGHAEIIRLLIGAGANVNAQDEGGTTPISMAAFAGEHEAVLALIAAHCNVNIASNSHLTPLHDSVFALARNRGIIVRTLINAGANLDAQDDLHWTPLHWHARLDIQGTSVRLLVQAGANREIRNIRGETAFESASHGPINQNSVDYFNDLPRLTAALQTAVRERNLTTTQDLIRQGAPLVDDQGNSIFEHIIGAYNLAQPTDDDTFTKEVIRILGPIAGTVRNREGRTALHIAAIRGNGRIAKYLVRHGGADVNAQDRGGNTPLHYAYTTRFGARTYQDRQYQGLVHKMRDDLLLLGANPSIRNRELKTAFLMHDNWRGALYAATHPADQAPAQ